MKLKVVQFCCLVLLLMVSTVVRAQFTVNNQSVVYNDLDSVYLCVIPDSCFMSDYKVTIQADTFYRTNMDIHVDSILSLDTLPLIDTVFQYDSIVEIDTIYQYDSILEIDTVYYIVDTIIQLDTILLYDTILQYDTILLYDTIVTIDTLQWQGFRYENTMYSLNDSLVFCGISGDKEYIVTAYFEDSTTHSFPISFTNLPIICLQGNFGYDYTEGVVSILCADSTSVPELMNAKIKWRGGTTNVEGKHKRNYTIKFINEKGKKHKRQLFGLRTHNQWILNAGQVDLARCRNQIGHELWADIARKPYYYEQAPDVRTSVRGKFVEVVLNGEYRGLYSISENVDKEQLQLVDHDSENGIFHGHLWKTDSWDGTLMNDLLDYDNTQEVYRGFETKYPDFDDVNPTDYSLLYNAISFTVRSSDIAFKQYVADYFDVPVLIDYYLFFNVLVARDNQGKNMMWACHDEQVDKKLTIGVWDLDCTVGQNYTDTDPHPDNFGPEVDTRQLRFVLPIKRLLNIPQYADSVQNRYWELHQTHLNADSLTARYEKYFQLFLRGGAAGREERKWSGDSDIAGCTLDFQKELDFIKDWIQRRFEFLNNGEFRKNNDVILSLDDVDVELPNDKVYTLLGQPVGTPIKSGIYIQNGKKIFIRP